MDGWMLTENDDFFESKVVFGSTMSFAIFFVGVHSLKLTVRTWKYAGPQKETGIPTIYFQVLCEFQGGYLFSFYFGVMFLKFSRICEMYWSEPGVIATIQETLWKPQLRFK